MLAISVNEFRAQMNVVLKKVKKGEIVTLQVRGVEIARIVPPSFAQQEARDALKRLQATAVVGDLLSPIGEVWESNP